MVSCDVASCDVPSCDVPSYDFACPSAKDYVSSSDYDSSAPAARRAIPSSLSALREGADDGDEGMGSPDVLAAKAGPCATSTRSLSSLT